MTYCCITCEFDKARANNAPGRRNLRPMIPPVAVTRDTAAGATNPEPGNDRLGQSSASTNREAGVEATTRTPGVDDPELSSWRTPTSSVGGETPSELATPVGLGGQGPALDTYPGSRGRVSGLPGHAGHVAARAATATEAPTVGVAS